MLDNMVAVNLCVWYYSNIMTVAPLEVGWFAPIRDNLFEHPIFDDQREAQRLLNLHERALSIFDTFVAHSVHGVTKKSELFDEETTKPFASHLTEAGFEMPLAVDGRPASATLVVERYEFYDIDLADVSNATGGKVADHIDFCVKSNSGLDPDYSEVLSVKKRLDSQSGNPYVDKDELGGDEGNLSQRVFEIERLFADIEMSMGIV